jgi:hypothetical protein
MLPTASSSSSWAPCFLPLPPKSRKIRKGTILHAGLQLPSTHLSEIPGGGTDLWPHHVVSLTAWDVLVAEVDRSISTFVIPREHEAGVDQVCFHSFNIY